ncbi:MAG: hypothetical protein LBL38_02005, partial [Lactobacillales bacterium]|nr:hypothetical protein [Lactobacillales bacterium]
PQDPQDPDYPNEKKLWLYNPWGNVSHVRGSNPGVEHNIASGLKKSAAEVWKMVRYTTFDY